MSNVGGDFASWLTLAFESGLVICTRLSKAHCASCPYGMMIAKRWVSGSRLVEKNSVTPHCSQNKINKVGYQSFVTSIPRDVVRSGTKTGEKNRSNIPFPIEVAISKYAWQYRKLQIGDN